MEQVGQAAERALRGEAGRKARGRQGRDGQEKVINLKALHERIDNLVELYNRNKTTQKELSEGVKATADKAGLLASVVRRFIVAKAGQNFDEKKKEAEQLSLVFDEIKA